MVDKKGKPKMQLKGRIFMQNVTDIIKASKSGMLCLRCIVDPRPEAD